MSRRATHLNSRLLSWLDDLRMTDVPDYGGKNASLGELLGNLAEKQRSGAGWRCHQRSGLPRLSFRSTS